MSETSLLEEMKRYLFREMAGEESEAVENRLFDDTDYFYELLTLEEDLIDRYVRGKLNAEDTARFERSLTKLPERREQVANARALQTLIIEEKPATAPFVNAPTLWERIAEFFTIKMSALQLATGALAILLAATTGFLLYRNQQAQAEFARLQNERQAELKQRTDLQNQIDQIERERQDLAAQLENTRGENEAAKAEDAKKQAEIEQLKRRLENLPLPKNNLPKTPDEITPPKPLLAFSILATGRGGNIVRPTVKSVIEQGKPKARVTVPLPADKNYASFEIITPDGTAINSGKIAEGAKSLTFNLSPQTTDFEIKVTERATRSEAESLGTYQLKLVKRR